MLYVKVLSSLQKVFLDEAPEAEEISLFSLLQNEYGAFQLAVKNSEKIQLQIKIDSPLDVKFFEVKNKIKIQEVQAAYKLSQNRNENDYQNIIDKLHEEKDLNS